MKLRKQAHTVYKKIKLGEIQKRRPDVEFVEIGTDGDHVHLHIIIPPKYSVSQIVAQLKGSTSKSMKEKFEFLRNVYYGTDAVWGAGFFVTTVGIDEESIRKYVKMQGEEDSGQAKLEF